MVLPVPVTAFNQTVPTDIINKSNGDDSYYRYTMRYKVGTLAIKRQEPLWPDVENNEYKKGYRKTNP